LTSPRAGWSVERTARALTAILASGRRDPSRAGKEPIAAVNPRAAGSLQEGQSPWALFD